MSSFSEVMQQLSGVDEVAWGEADTSMTGAQIYPIAARIDFSGIARAMIESPRVVAYKDEVPRGIPGAWQDASFTVELELAGHGSTTAGAVAETALGEFLAWVFGDSLTAPAGTTISGANTAVALTTVASGTFPAGAMFRCGAPEDGHGEGQWNNVASHATTTLTGLLEFDAAPQSPEVVYSAQTIYTKSSFIGGALTSKRFRAMSADFQAVMHGCFVKGAVLTGTNPGEVSHASITIGVSWAEPVSATFPDAVSTAPWTYNPAVVAGGSVALQPYGSATRLVGEARSVTISYQMGIVPEFGYNAVNGAQVITGAKRGPDRIAVTVIVAAAGPSATPTYWDAWAATTPYQLMLSLAIGLGQAVGIYFRRLIWTGKQPTQVGHNGLNAVQLDFMASSDPTGTTEAAKAAMVMGLG